MGLIRNIAIGVLLISVFTFIALFGRLPALRATPIGFLHRLLVLKLPAAVHGVDTSISGGHLTSCLVDLETHIAQDRHPYVLVFFLILLTVSACLFLGAAWERVAPYPHHLSIPILLVLPYIFTYLTATSNASLITTQNHHAHLQTYPFDHALFQPATICRTCNREKPARSKHCPLCRTCVARYDHHCVWVNTCVGESNYRWFIGLLASLGVLLSYGAYLGFMLLTQSPAFSNPGYRDGLQGWFDKFATSLSADIFIGGVGLLAAFTAPLAWGLFVYHFYLAWAGMTTNETSKWADLRLAMDEGTVWKGTKLPEPELDKAYFWPRECQQVVAVFYDGAHPTTLNLDFVQEGSWTECYSLKDLDNLYDLGMMGNICDALKLR